MFQPLLEIEKSSIETQPGASEIIVSILDEVGDLAKLMEMFYLSRENGLLDIMRWLAALPEEARREVYEFAKAGRPQSSIKIERTHDGTLVIRHGGG
jgi:hypothetical protein